MLYIDITRLYYHQKNAKTVTGVDRVSLAYIDQLADIAYAMIRLPKQWLFFSKQESVKLFWQIQNNVPIKLPKRWLRFLYRKPAQCGCFLLNTSHSGLEDPDYLQKMQDYDLRGIYFLHDLIPIEYPEYCREGEYEKHQQRLLTMSKGVLVIANSQNVANKFKDYCAFWHLDCPKTIEAHIGIEDVFGFHGLDGQDGQNDCPLYHRLKQRPFFLMIGTIEARKNHMLMLMVWKDLAEKFGCDDCPQLVIVGKRGWEAEQVFDILDRSLQLRSCVVELNSCSDDDLLWLFEHARALLFPSFCEGYGLPLVEALKSNLPVIASDIDIFHEIGFGVVELINPNHTQIWQKKILQYWHDDDYRARQVAKITYIKDKLPTWDEHFAVVMPNLLKTIECGGV